MAPFEISVIDHVVLRIRDLGKSLEFYIGVLGCREEKRQDSIGLVQLRAGASLIDLVTLDGPSCRAGGEGPGSSGRNLDHFALQIAPFDESAIRSHLAKHGVAIVESGLRYGAQGTGPSIYVNDPDGNTVELKGPPQSPPA